VLRQVPVNEGHLLVLPRRHFASWFYGYNIGINIGEAAGQTIMHLHVHLIPRYRGDCPDPRGGVRGVIPSKQWYPQEGEAT
jgi:diadenosine tetraphosphate (Ap4A) HIT family hydrolase